MWSNFSKKQVEVHLGSRGPYAAPEPFWACGSQSNSRPQTLTCGGTETRRIINEHTREVLKKEHELFASNNMNPIQ